MVRNLFSFYGEINNSVTCVGMYIGISVYIASFVLKSEAVSVHLNMKGSVCVCDTGSTFLEIICSGSVECISLSFVRIFFSPPLSMCSFTPSQKFGKVEMEQRCRRDRGSVNRGY